MKSAIFVLIVALFVAVAQGQTAYPRFTADFKATETYTGPNGVEQRIFSGKFFYEATWDDVTKTGRDRMKYEIQLASGVVTQTLEELTIWEDQFFQFTICDGECAWQDIFAEEPMPRLYFDPALDTSPVGTETVNGFSTQYYDVDGTNSVGDFYNNWVRIWVRTGSNRYVEKAEITYPSSGVTRLIEFTGQSGSFNSNELRVPSYCPDIEPGCFRLDIMFVLDLSGSVGTNGPDQELDFLYALTSQFVIDSKHFAVGLASFSYCRDTYLWDPIQWNKNVWLNQLTAHKADNTNFRNNGFTCIVGGVQRGFWAFATVNGSRPATAKTLIVLTDGNGNRPCNHVGPYTFPTSDCYEFGDIPSNAFMGQVDSGCLGKPSECNANLCCQQMHNYHLQRFYQLYYDTYSPTIYAIGVGVSVSTATLEQIINDPAALARGEPRKFTVNDFDELNTIIAVILAAILCDVPGSRECPNDCRPGGFCCAGGCICSVDCSGVGNECQEGYCAVNDAGASCERGPVQNSVCQNSNVQCQYLECQDGIGCVGTPDDTLSCTDNNKCTDDACSNGTCVTVVNPAVSQCTDNNDCTVGDECLPDGQCVGTVDDLQSCDDRNECTDTTCSNGECVVVDVTVCSDDDTSDCIVYVCDKDTGDCEPLPVEEGDICRPPPAGDNCTVYICAKFDPEEYENCVAENGGDDTDCDKGKCRERTRDLDECKGSSDNVGAIIGGVVAGVAFIAILILLLIIFLLILCRKPIVAAVGTFAGFGSDVTITQAATYDPGNMAGTNAVYS